MPKLLIPLVRRFAHVKAARLLAVRRTGLVAALMAGAACLVGTASAAEAVTGQALAGQLPVAQVFTILFLMLGPFKILGPFLKVTGAADDVLTRRIALWATVFSALALLIAGSLGEFFLSRFGIPLPVLSLAGGLIFFLVAFKSVLEQFEHPGPPTDEPAVPPPSVMRVAMAPLAFPMIVTPYGIAAVIVMIAVAQTLEGRLTIGAVVVAIMVVNLVFMLLARRLRMVLGLVLPILGAVLGVIQVALGLQIINNALHALGVL